MGPLTPQMALSPAVGLAWFKVQGQDSEQDGEAALLGGRLEPINQAREEGSTRGGGCPETTTQLTWEGGRRAGSAGCSGSPPGVAF